MNALKGIGTFVILEVIKNTILQKQYVLIA